MRESEKKWTHGNKTVEDPQQGVLRKKGANGRENLRPQILF